MEEVNRRLESENANVRHIILVLLGAGINFTLGLGVMLSGLFTLVNLPTPTLTPTSLVILVVSYFIIGIIYSTIASLSFQPKRIISPIYTQAVTSVFVPVLFAYIYLSPLVTTPDLVSFSSLLFFLWIFSFSIFIIAGVGQTRIVRYLVGLNGTKENTNSLGLLINGAIEDVLKVLRNDGFQDALHIRRERRVEQHSFVFSTSHAEEKQLYIAIVADPNDNKKTQLAMVSYEQRYYGINKIGALLEEINEDGIMKALRNAGFSFKKDDTDSHAKSIANNHAPYVTESKLLTLRALPRYEKAILIGITIMVTIMTALWKYNFINLDMYETFLILAGFAILFDFLPLLGTRKRKSEFD